MASANLKEPFPTILRKQRESRGDTVFLRDVDGGCRTYAQVDVMAGRWSRVLTGLDITSGDKVATLLPTSITGVEVWFGINYAGAVDVPVHTDYRSALLTHVLESSHSRVLVVAASLIDRCRDIDWSVLGDLSHLVVVGGLADRAASWVPASVLVHDADQLLLGIDPAPSPTGAAHDVASVLFTSGTTGRPKGVLVTYSQLLATTEGCWPLKDFGVDDVYYAPVPLHHISGKLAVITALLTGGQALLRERFKTSRFFPDVRQFNVTAVCLVGAMAAFLMDLPPAEDEAATTLDKVLLLPLPPYLDEFRRRFGVRVCTIYNQTEISVPINSAGWVTEGFQSCGRVRAGYQCRIVDENDYPVPPGEVGELVVRADDPWALMNGYLGLPEKTVHSWRNLWYHTGDAFRADADGNFYFVDRLNDVIRRRGENISSYELETAVLKHPAVAECAAIAIKSEWTEDEVKIVIVLQPGMELSPQELVDFLADEVPRFMLPRFVSVVDQMPKTPTERVRKAELIRMHADEPGWDREAVQAGTPPKATEPSLCRHEDGVPDHCPCHPSFITGSH